MAPPGGETVNISVLFVDIRGFTSLAEQLEPAEVATQLNRFYKTADYTVIGDTVNVAARLQGEAASGEILISQETYARVVMEFPFAKRHELLLKGKSEPVIAWEIAQGS